MFFKMMTGEWLKLRKTPVMLAHILIPVIVSVVFLAYYAISPWSEPSKISAFYQALGVGFPVLIGIFAANTAEQEQNAGEYQNLLSLPNKRKIFIVKVWIYLILGLFSVIMAALLFGIGFQKMFGGAVGLNIYLMAALLMWVSSIPIYIWLMYLAFRFGKGVSIGAGIIFGLISALMLTGMGLYIWHYVPVDWTGRIPDTFIRAVFGEISAVHKIRKVLPIYCIFTVFSMLYYVIWASRWEGGKILE